MGIAERKEREKQELKNAILEAALDIFKEDGLEAVSVRKIADRIEYSHTTIYLYFKDKNEIFFELRHIGFSELQKRHIAYAEKEEDLRAKFKAYGKAYIDFALENPQYYKLMFINMAPLKTNAEGRKDASDPGHIAWAELVNYVQAGIDAGQISFPSAEVGAFFYHSMVHGMVSLHIQRRVPTDDETTHKLIYTAYDTVMNGPY